MFNFSNQEKITIILLLIVIIVGVGIVLNKNINKEDNFIINRASDISENNVIQIEVPPVIIHIAGAVKNPGVYQLKSTDRIVDAVKIAGGASEEANLDSINLAALLKDGQKIIVPCKTYSETGEEININTYENTESIYSSSSLTSTSAKININTANANMLQTLPGIGPVLSERIIEYRNQNGLFSVIDDIKDVSGIAEKKFEGIEELICVQ